MASEDTRLRQSPSSVKHSLPSDGWPYSAALQLSAQTPDDGNSYQLHNDSWLVDHPILVPRAVSDAHDPLLFHR